MAKGKNKLPKTILGVPVPRELRRSGALEAVLSSPAIRKILAEALIAAAAAAAASLTQTRAGGGVKERASEGGGDSAGNAAGKGRETLQNAGGALGTVLSEVARTILPGEDDREPAKRKAKAGKGRKRDRDTERVHH